MVVVDPHIVAKTERLLLRPLKLEDAEDVVLMRKHPEVMKHTSVLTERVHSLQPSDSTQVHPSQR
jgi:RimJ/RimL family protein N-acetyltransferase